jgi:hypothetical protein
LATHGRIVKRVCKGAKTNIDTEVIVWRNEITQLNLATRVSSPKPGAETKRGREQQVHGAALLATLGRALTARPNESARFCIKGTISGQIKHSGDL